MSEPRGAVLFDVNLLIALAWPNHVHHRAGHAWLERQGERTVGDLLDDPSGISPHFG